MAKYFYSFEGRTLGPVSSKEIMNLILDDQLNTDSYVMESHTQQWIKINQFPDLMRFLHESVIRLSFNEKDADSVLAQDEHTPLFFHYPLNLTVLWTFVSFGWFQIYWFYRNWHFLRYYRKGKTSLSFWRDAINPFAIVGVFDSIEIDKDLLKHGGRPDLFIGKWLWLFSLVIFGVASFLLSWVPGAFSDLLVVTIGLAALAFSLLLMLPVQRYINKANADDNRDLSKTGLGLTVMIILGVSGWLTTIWQVIAAIF